MESRKQPQDASSSILVWDYDEYIPSRIMDTPIIILSKLENSSYKIERNLKVSEEDLHGKVDKIVIVDCDIRDSVNFHDLTKINYVTSSPFISTMERTRLLGFTLT